MKPELRGPLHTSSLLICSSEEGLPYVCGSMNKSCNISESCSTAVQVLEELSAVFHLMSSHQSDTTEDAFAVLKHEILCAQSHKIVLHGVGREGLMMKALAMRLCHLGLSAHCVGDMGTPPVGPGDLLLVSAGPGGFSTVDALIRVAKSAGARTAVITAQMNGVSASLADAIAYLPAKTMANDVAAESFIHNTQQEGGPGILPMGSVYEGALFVLGEVLVGQLRGDLGESLKGMRSRHTNLE